MSLETNKTPSLSPLPCDRWIARSCFQKAIRRGDEALAVRALANLFLHDPRAVWRHLTIVALEDVGVANVEILKAIVSAKQEHSSLRAPDLLWSTFAVLADQMATSNHDQAICDLLMRVENGPDVSDPIASDGRPETCASVLYDRDSSMLAKATAALCFGGFMEVPFPADPEAVFEILSESASDAGVAMLARSLWKLSRNPMALLLPLVWSAWGERSPSEIRNDFLPGVDWIDGIPAYALDQFTRVGKAAIRDFVLHDAELQAVLRDAGVERNQWPSVAGDVLFLVEGGPCCRRTVWAEAEALRSPARWLRGTPLLGQHVKRAKMRIASNASQLSQFRQQHFHRSR